MESANGKQSNSYMTYIEAAEYLSVSVNTLRQWVSKGMIPFYKIPGSNQVRFKREDLDNWMQQGFRAPSVAFDR